MIVRRRLPTFKLCRGMYTKNILKNKGKKIMCKECKDCWNYKVSEIGRYGSDKPCEYYTSENKDEIIKLLSSLKTDKERQ